MKEQPSPLTPEEKYNLEGMTPEMREAAKQGLLPTVEEEVEMLEVKATRELPWEKISKTPVQKKEISTEETVSRQPREGIGDLRVVERELASRFNEFINQHPELVSSDFIEAYNNFAEIEDIFPDIYARTQEFDQKKKGEVMGQFNEMLKVKLFLLEEELARMKSKLEGNK